MAIRKTSTLLPGVFQTNKNKKFLNATTDQLYSEPSKKRLSGFIGRRDALNRTAEDSYLTEIDVERQNYQLEPSVVYKNSSNTVESVSTYIDYLNSIKYYGEDAVNHDSLFKQKYYNYSGFVDIDKLVNYGEYFWLPSGPDSVPVYTNIVPTTKSFTVYRSTDPNEKSYRFDSETSDENPIVYLARGGSYTFEVNQLGHPFWIQSESGTTGISAAQKNISTREVPGVDNNGDDVGTITWTVPQKDSQLYYTNMPVATTVDLAYNGTYSSIHNQLLSNFADGIDSFTEIVGKNIIFINNSVVETDWEVGALYDAEGFDSGTLEGDAGTFDPVTALTPDARRRVYKITTESIRGVDVIKLQEVSSVSNLNRVKISNGKAYGNRQFYRDAEGFYQIVPPLVAEQDTFFYADATDSTRFGTIKLVEIDAQPNLDIDDIITRTEFTSPNGVTFTNGLKVAFDSSVTPTSYANKEYYVEGVGTKIDLVPVDELISPETFITTASEPYDKSGYDETGFEGSRAEPLEQDYIVINRASNDRNPWSRINRWFHRDVIEKTAVYNDYTPVIDDDQRATRPIIEFLPGLELYNFGQVGIAPADIVDTTQTDALSNVNGTTGYFSDGIELAPGMTIIFTNDADADVRNKVYTISLIDEDDVATTDKIIQLTETSTVVANNVVVSTLGATNQGKSFVYQSTGVWKETQQKTALNQEPLFNLNDQNHVNFDDETTYPSSTFAGSKLFSYKRNSSASADSVLGFGLSYRNLNNIGDILFDNNFETDTFQYTKDGKLINVILRSGHAHQFDSSNVRTIVNGWTEIAQESKQFQVYNYTVNENNLTKFDYEIPYTIDTEKNIKVFVNGKIIKDSEYTIGSDYTVNFVTNRTVGDIVTIKIYNKDIKGKNSYYEIPDNLENNSNNANFETLTLGQMRNHLSVISQHIVEFSGSTPGFSNIRDLPYGKYKGKILQHSAGAILPIYMMTNPHVNVIPAIDYTKNEYTRFKNKFIENLNTLDLDLTNKSKTVDDILSSMVGGKTDVFPFFYSDMVPWGNTGTTTTHTVDDTSETFFTFNSQFDLNTESRQGVLVYINNELKVFGVDNDYTFDTSEGAVIFTSTVSLAVDDVVKIVEYSNTNGNFIPPTPTKLGLYNKFVPQKITDTSYVVDQTVIIGHDGSRWVGYGDIRDDIILELEKRIYNNIKTNYNRNLIDYAEVLPGYFRNTTSELSSVNRIINKYFQQWSNKNSIAINSTTVFDADQPFTWNYKNAVEKTNSSRLPGYWRGIYRWFYDTETPNTTPWEMLGLSVKPSWWTNRYGPAPYTSGNSILWEDLRDGKLYSDASGTAYTVLEKYKRSTLLDFIPVDEQGALKSPAQFLSVDATSANTSDKFIFGDGDPVETAWRRSSEWPYIVQIVAMLRKPAKYGTLMFDTNLFDTNQTGWTQILQKTKAYRPTLAEFYINSGSRQTLGYNQFVGEYGTYLGVNVTDLQTRIQNLNVNLAYKLSGYADKSFLRVVAENATPTSTQQNTFIPDEDYELITHKSTPLEKVSYSGVQVIKRANGFEVQGYDLDYPFFNIVPSTRSANSNLHSVGNVSYVEYKDFENTIVGIPYGTVIQTPQQMFDFLIAYQRWLKLKGIKFIDALGNGMPQDFVLAAKEFVFWNDQQWPIDSVITLSPIFDRIQVERQYTTVDDISKTGYLRNENRQLIRPKNYDVSRIGNTTDIFVNTDEENIYAVSVDPIQYEHVVVFNNRTIFSDVIYQPELGSRQDRLKLIGFKSGDWDGTIHAPGFIINDDIYDIWVANRDYKKGDIVTYRNLVYVAKLDHTGQSKFDFEYWKQSDLKTGLLPNLNNRSKQLENFYNIDDLNLENQVDQVAKGQLGFRKRDYLENLGLDDISQVKFYQGLIGAKGSTSSINKLINANLTNYDQSINFYEEWGFRVGEYGSTRSNQIIELAVDEATAQANPTVIHFHEDGEVHTTTVNPNHNHYSEKDLYKVPVNYDASVFKLQDTTTHTNNEIQDAGYVRLDDVEYTSYNIDNLKQLDANKSLVGRGDKIWFAKSGATWDVRRIQETRTNLLSVDVSAVDNQVRFNFDSDHNLVKNDWFFIQSTFTVGGFHKVVNVASPTSVIVLGLTTEVGVQGIKEPLFKVATSRFTQLKDVSTATPLMGWNQGEKVWVDSDENNKWAVFYKNEPYSSTGTKSTSGVVANGNLGQAVAISQGASQALVGAPQSSTGKVVPYNRTTSGGALQEANSITVADISSSVDSFGAAIGLGLQYAAIGAPDTATDKGAVFVYSVGSDGVLSHIQSIIGASGENFGTQVHVTGNDRYMFITAPGDNKIYTYQYEALSTTLQRNYTATGDASTTEFALGFTPVHVSALNVLDSDGKVYFPGSDFTISSSNITFTTAPADGLKVVIRQNSYFRQTDSVTVAGIGGSDALGTSLDATYEGNTFIAGAPYATVDSVSNAGQAHVFDQVIETFIGDAVTTDFTTTTTLPTVGITVKKNGIIQTLTTGEAGGDGSSDGFYSRVGNVITMRATPSDGDVIEVFTGTWELTQTIDQDGFGGQTVTDSENFGFSVGIDTQGSYIAVGSPGEDEINPNTGSVLVYVNTAKRYGEITSIDGTYATTSSDSIFVNGREVSVSDTSTDPNKLVADIVNANIPNVTAENVDGQIKIISTNTAVDNKLTVTKGVGDTLSEAGIKPFTFIQKITHPLQAENENFGRSVAFDKYVDNRNGKTYTYNLVVSSDKASSVIRTRFDLNTNQNSATYNQYTTTFDQNSTQFITKKPNSGAGYVYQLLDAKDESVTNHNQYGFVQHLSSQYIDTNDSFGSAIALQDNVLFVGAKDDDAQKSDGGSVYEFKNTNRLDGWSKYRSQDSKVDVDCINRIMLYNKDSQQIEIFLDNIDGAKGKIAGEALAEIDYMTPYDPADYTESNTTKGDWISDKLGRVWWNLDTATYINYEQGSDDYRTQYWNTLFPGSSVDVYEWVESITPPQQYQGEGTPFDVTKFSTAQIYNAATNTVNTRYYFWVKDKVSVPVESAFRNISIDSVTKLIENPKSAGVSYCGVVAEDQIALFNCESFFSGKDTILSVDFDVVKNNHVVHSEFELVTENDANGIVPKVIYDKLVDSLSGIDSLGNAVPDPFLSDAEKYGVGYRPRQSIFKNNRHAIKVMVQYANKELAKLPITRSASITGLQQKESIPTSVSGKWNKQVASIVERDFLNTAILATGYKVLVLEDENNDNYWTIYNLDATKTWNLVQIQSFDTTRYWSYQNYYSTGYNNASVPNYQIQTEADLLTLTSAVTGETAKVLTNDDGNFSFFELKSDGTWSEVIIENGTIQFSSKLFDYDSTDVGTFDVFGTAFDLGQYDRNTSQEVRYIIKALKDDIFVNELAVNFNKLFFRLIEYALHETDNQPDWVIKTSFLKVLHKVRNLDQYPTFKYDNQTFIEDFINETKPYHTKIREYVPSYEKIDTYGSDVTDFDVHSYYDTVEGRFRKPDGSLSGDTAKLSEGLNTPWNDNYGYKLSSIVIQAGGTGYIVNPTVTISAPQLSGGVTATATAITNGDKIIRVNITNYGSGYTQTPTVTVEGSGTGADLLPRIENNTTRDFDTTLKFDRIAYSSTVKDWAKNTSYSVNDIVAYQNTTTKTQEVYTVTTAFTSGNTFSTENSSGTTVMTVYADEDFSTAADRIAGYYYPSEGMLGDDIGLLQNGTTYPGTVIEGPSFSDEPGYDSGNFDTVQFDSFEIDTDGLTVLGGGSLLDSKIESLFTDLSLGQRPEDIDIDGGAFVDTNNSHAPEELVPGRVFDTLDMEVYTDPGDDYEANGNGWRSQVKSFLGDGTTRTFAYGQEFGSKTDFEFHIVYIDTTRQSTGYSIDYRDQTVSFDTAPTVGQTVHIYSHAGTGEKMTADKTFIADGSTSTFTLGQSTSTIQQLYGFVNGVLTNTTFTGVDNRTAVNFPSGAPPQGAHIHIFGFNQASTRDAMSILSVEDKSLTSGTLVYSLSNTIKYAQPMEGNVVVELDGHRLRPSNTVYHTATGSETNFAISTTAGESAPAGIGDIRVAKISAGVTTNLIANDDFSYDSATGEVTPVVQPSNGDIIIVGNVANAEYLISGDGTSITLDGAVSFTTGQTLKITSFSNHDPLRIRTQVFVGTGNGGRGKGTYLVGRTATDNAYLWVTHDGVRLHPGDFTLEDDILILSEAYKDITTGSTELILTQYTQNTIQDTLGFRIFYDMLGVNQYRRLAIENTTFITQDVSPTDTKIYVNNANALPFASRESTTPGVVFIGSERITYWEISYEDHFITGLRRGTGGTTFTDFIEKETTVVDGGLDQELPASDTHTKTWYDLGTGNAADGNGLQQSTTTNANFLKEKKAELPNFLKELNEGRYVVDDYVETGYVEGD